jgi:hypothetical protein
MINLNTASMPELLAYFNANSGKPPVKRFADRKSALKRIAALSPAAVPTTPTVPAVAPTEQETGMAKAKAKKVKPTTKKNGVNSGWDDPQVRKARATHHKVKVSGEVYRSVLEAFKALKLPVGRHIGFRGKLKAADEGRLTFEHEDKKYNFILVTE